MTAQERQADARFPPHVVDAFSVAQTHRDIAPPDSAGALSPRFTLAQAKSIISKALHEYDPALGRMADDILASADFHHDGHAPDGGCIIFNSAAAADENPYLRADYTLPDLAGGRWHLTAVPAGQTNLMRCLPAHSPQRETVTRYFDPANPNDYAVIEFSFDGTMNSVVYMAHEIGHAIADDCGRDAGHDFHENPQHMQEVQAYFAQMILYDSLRRGNDPEWARAADDHMRAALADNFSGLTDEAVMHERPLAIFSARALVTAACGQNAEARVHIADTVMGHNGPLGIEDCLAAAGIAAPDELPRAAADAVRFVTDTAVDCHGETIPRAAACVSKNM